MASAWISGMIASGVQSAIQPAVASAGSYAGGFVSGVGSGINGVGETVNGHIRRYGTGVQDYGNAIRDWTSAEGPRAQTATNPLGLSATTAGGKHAVSRPSLPPPAEKSKSPPSSVSSQIGNIAAKRARGIQAPPKKSEMANARVKVRPLASSKAVANPTSKPTIKGADLSGRSGTDLANRPASTKVKISPESKPQNLKPRSNQSKRLALTTNVGRPQTYTPPPGKKN